LSGVSVIVVSGLDSRQGLRRPDAVWGQDTVQM
jgi:hypothetical protein